MSSIPTPRSQVGSYHLSWWQIPERSTCQWRRKEKKIKNILFKINRQTHYQVKYNMKRHCWMSLNNCIWNRYNYTSWTRIIRPRNSGQLWIRKKILPLPGNMSPLKRSSLSNLKVHINISMGLQARKIKDHKDQIMRIHLT